MSEKKSKEILSTILNRGIVKKYYALKMTRYTMKYFKEVLPQKKERLEKVYLKAYKYFWQHR